MIDVTMKQTPDIMPVLSRGSHRSPRKGACLMELASYLAGERWSDHPACTHPLLAALAREVNDRVGDDTRQGLAQLIPDVVGLNGDDPRVYSWIALEAARTALPVVSAERQRVMAVAILHCERTLNVHENRRADHLSAASRRLLADAPEAARWAECFTRMGWGRARSFERRSAPSIVRCAVEGISNASVQDPDGILVGLLQATVANCRTWFEERQSETFEPRHWQAMCELTSR